MTKLFLFFIAFFGVTSHAVQMRTLTCAVQVVSPFETIYEREQSVLLEESEYAYSNYNQTFHTTMPFVYFDTLNRKRHLVQIAVDLGQARVGPQGGLDAAGAHVTDINTGEKLASSPDLLVSHDMIKFNFAIGKTRIVRINCSLVR